MTTRQPDHPVDPIFPGRHSPRSFTEAALPQDELMILLEAARWAPSGSNVQPARHAWGLRGTAAFATIAGLLAPSNRVWAEKAAALVVIASLTETTRDGKTAPHPSHAFDAGAAWMSLALQAHLRGWIAHAMGGFDKTCPGLDLPAAAQAHVVVAIGRQGPAEALPEALRPREMPNARKPLAEIAAEGRFPPQG